MIKGGCFCGAVRYELRGQLLNARACHCSKCRKVFSGAGSAYAEVDPAVEFEWTCGEGDLSWFSSVPDWQLAFCRVCGSSLAGVYQGAVHGVTLGSVDGDPGVEIEAHYFVGSKAPWDHIGGSAPQYEEGPPPPPD